MVTSKQTIEKIREIVSKHYARLTISVLGNDVFTPKELEQLRAQGVDTSNTESLLSLIYNHSFINSPIDEISPKSTGEAKTQQSVAGLKPIGQANSYSTESLNDRTRQSIDKLKMEAMTRIENIIRQNNDNYKFDALQNLNRDPNVDQLIRESTLGSVRSKLRDTAGEANRDWVKVAVTELSNAVGIGSVDRIVTDNQDKDPDDIYVYRVTVKDSVTCKWCRKFYDDSDGTAQLYKLSTLLDNGSNYGKKPDQWQPVVGSTHPNTRTSQIIELKPGFALTSGGPKYIGLDKWNSYIAQKLTK